MISSMTGYSRLTEVVDNKEITIEIKSVNHRYFDYNCRIPRAYGYLEDLSKKYIQQFISRGKVDVSIIIEIQEDDDVKISVNKSLVKGYLDAIYKMRDDFDLIDDVRVSTLLRYSDIFRIDKKEQDQNEIWTAVKVVLEKCVADYVNMRDIEGEKLFADISNRAKGLLKLVDKIEPLAINSIESYKQRLLVKMQNFLEDKTIDENRLLAEVAIFADKIAIDEEIVRIRSHISQILSLVNTSDPVGRKLDFIIQELNREINTIGSKSNEIEISKLVVDFKSELEKIREQVQNIE